jgi:hypothetical protein
MCDCGVSTGCICVYVYGCLRVCVCVCVCVSVCVCLYIHIYIYISICEFDVNVIKGFLCLVIDGTLLLIIIQIAFHEEEFCLFEHFKITNLLISILLLPEGVF